MSRIFGRLTVLGLVVLAAACASERGGTGPSAASCAANLDPGSFGSVIVAIQGFSFNPTPVHVPVGGKVTWVNCEPEGTPSHTTTSDGGAWGSSPLEPGTSYTVTFPAAGTFAYHCEPHPSMTAQVIVQ
jgi:plastocyanin